MTDYTNKVDIRSYYMDNTTDPDYITDAEIERYITETSTIIDLKLQKKYTLPFSNASDLIYLKLVCEKMIVCKIDKIIRANSTEEENQNFDRRRGYCKEGQQMIDDLLNGSIELTSPQKSFRPMKYNTVEGEDEKSFC